jgi:predicted nucleic-acid-binding protein
VKAIDTNVLVRFLVNDDPRQSKAAREIFRKAELARESLHVSSLVLLETIWVLESAYGIGREALVETLGELLLLPTIEFEDRALVQATLAGARSPVSQKVDLSDLLIGHRGKLVGCTTTLTFDKQAGKLPEFELVN